MVHVNAGDDRTVGIDHIGGVQPATQSHFQHHHIQLDLAEQVQDGQRRELKIGERYHIAP